MKIFKQELAKIQKNFRVDVLFKRVAVNHINNTFKVHTSYLNDLKEVQGFTFFPFPQDVKLKESQREHQPIAEYAPECKFHLAVELLTREIVKGAA